MTPPTYHFQADLDGLPNDFSELFGRYIRPAFAAAGFPPGTERDDRRHRHGDRRGSHSDAFNFTGHGHCHGGSKAWGRRCRKDGLFGQPSFTFTTSTSGGVASNGDAVNVEYTSGDAGPVDLLEKDDGFLVVLSLAGVKLSELQVHYNAGDHELLISGNTPEISGLDGYTKLVTQRPTGDFSLKVSLPSSAKIDEDGIRAKGSNGVVKIFLPKLKDAKSGVKVVVEEDESADEATVHDEKDTTAETNEKLVDEKDSMRSRTASVCDDSDTVVVNVE